MEILPLYRIKALPTAAGLVLGNYRSICPTLANWPGQRSHLLSPLHRAIARDNKNTDNLRPISVHKRRLIPKHKYFFRRIRIREPSPRHGPEIRSLALQLERWVCSDNGARQRIRVVDIV